MSRAAWAVIVAVVFAGCGGTPPADPGATGGGDGGGAGGGVGGGAGGGASNQPPVFGTLSPVAVDEGSSQIVTLTATDPENGALDFTLTSAPSFVTLSGAAGAMTLTISPGFSVVGPSQTNKTFTLGVRVSDGTNNTDGSIALTVNSVNRAPTLDAISDVTMFAGATRTVALVGTDPDGDPLTYSLGAGAPAWASVAGSTLTLTPPVTTGPASFSLAVTASDGGLSASRNVQISVTQGVVSGTVSINSAAPLTNSAAVTLALTASSTGGNVTQMRFSNDGTTFSALEPFSATKSWTLSTGDGAKTVTAELVDENGATKQAAATITLDASAPTLSDAVLNGGAAWLKTSTLSLVVTASDGTGSGLSEICVTGDVASPGCVPYSATAVALGASAGDGNKQLSVTVKDAAGNVSNAKALQIGVDATAPTVSSLVINGGAAATNNLSLSMATTASDGTGSGLAQMQFSADGTTWDTPQAFASALSYPVPAGDGQRTYSVRVTDLAGNQSQPLAATIIIDQTAPTNLSVSINSGASGTTSQSLTLTLNAVDPYAGVSKICIKSMIKPAAFTTPTATDSCFSTNYATSLPYTLTTGDGDTRVAVWFLDAAGNATTTYAFDDIYLDRQAPTLPSFTVTSVAYRRIGLTITAATDPAPSSFIRGYQVKFRPQGSTAPFVAYPSLVGAGATFINLHAATTWELTVEALDNAGNSSGPSAPGTATTYFPWDHSNRTPTSRSLSGVDVIGGTRFITTAENAGVSGAETYMDNEDAFATVNRVDWSGRAVKGAGNSDRALIVHVFNVAASSDLGRTWWPIALSPGGTFYYDAAHVKSEVVNGADVDTWAVVGSNGGLWTGKITTAPGQVPTGTLNKIATNTTNTLNDVAALGDVVIAVGGNGTILRSTDAGLSFSPVTNPAGSSSINTIAAVPGTTIFYAGYGSGLLRSTDSGVTWTTVSGLGGSISALAVGGSGASYTLWVMTSSTVRQYDGTSVQNVPMTSLSPGPSSLQSIAAIGFGQNAKAAVVGSNGELITFEQNGAVVTRRSAGGTQFIRDVDWADASTEKAIFVATDAKAYLTANHGLSWTAETLPTTQALYSVHPFADDSAVAIGAAPAVFRRSTAGVWSSVSTTAQNWRAMSCVSTGSCLATGGGAAAPQTLFFDATTGTATELFATGSTTRAYEGAALWADSTSALRGVVVGQNGIFRSCTGCTTASSFAPEGTVVSNPVAHFSAVAGRSSGTVVAVGVDGGGTWAIGFRSTDHGASWTKIANIGSFRLYSVAHVAGTNTWYAAGDRNMARSTDDGVTWTDVPTYTSSFDGYGLAVTANAAGKVSILGGGTVGDLLYSASGGL